MRPQVFLESCLSLWNNNVNWRRNQSHFPTPCYCYCNCKYCYRLLVCFLACLLFAGPYYIFDDAIVFHWFSFPILFGKSHHTNSCIKPQFISVSWLIPKNTSDDDDETWIASFLISHAAIIILLMANGVCGHWRSSLCVVFCNCLREHIFWVIGMQYDDVDIISLHGKYINFLAKSVYPFMFVKIKYNFLYQLWFFW